MRAFAHRLVVIQGVKDAQSIQGMLAPVALEVEFPLPEDVICGGTSRPGAEAGHEVSPDVGEIVTQVSDARLWASYSNGSGETVQ